MYQSVLRTCTAGQANTRTQTHCHTLAAVRCEWGQVFLKVNHKETTMKKYLATNLRRNLNNIYQAEHFKDTNKGKADDAKASKSAELATS